MYLSIYLPTDLGTSVRLNRYPGRDQISENMINFMAGRTFWDPNHKQWWWLDRNKSTNMCVGRCINMQLGT